MTRVICVSDLHENWIDLPEGDIAVVAGDLTYGFKHDYASQQKTLIGPFQEWAARQPVKHVVCIAGNHDQSVQAWGWPIQGDLDGKLIYLQDSGAEVCGLKVWGTPWQPWFYSWAFNAPERNGEAFLRQKFSLIPEDTDIIICHGPPYGAGDSDPPAAYLHLDASYDSQPRIGSRALAATIRRIKPKLMVCGHIHYGYGEYEFQRCPTKIVNAAIVNNSYKPVNPPIVVDLSDDDACVALDEASSRTS